MEKYEEGNGSENEDDPEVFGSSSDEWSEGAEKKKKGKGGGGGGGGGRRAAPARGKKAKAKVPVEESESEDDDEDEEEDEDEDEPKPKSKNGIKRAKLDESDSTPAKKKSSGGGGGGGGKGGGGAGTDFVNGGFLILKTDAKAGESKQPCLWRIDGKSLLQKYEPFQEDGQLRHRNTNIYTGWSSNDKELYYPVTVKVLQHQKQNMTVELNWEKLKELCAEDE